MWQTPQDCSNRRRPSLCWSLRSSSSCCANPSCGHPGDQQQQPSRRYASSARILPDWFCHAKQPKIRPIPACANPSAAGKPYLLAVSRLLVGFRASERHKVPPARALQGGWRPCDASTLSSAARSSGSRTFASCRGRGQFVDDLARDRPMARGDRAQPDRAWPHPRHRRARGAGDAGRQRGVDRGRHSATPIPTIPFRRPNPTVSSAMRSRSSPTRWCATWASRSRWCWPTAPSSPKTPCRRSTLDIEPLAARDRLAGVGQGRRAAVPRHDRDQLRDRVHRHERVMS